MKLGILIPTRGDRPEFLEFARRQLAAQTIQPDLIEIVDDPPRNAEKDITLRYKLGCQRLFDRGSDLVAFVEDDDFYRPDYLQTMVDLWESNGRPDCVGIDTTYYYHLGIRKWLSMRHPGRSSAFCTMVTPKILQIRWPADNHAFLDIDIWKQLGGKSVTINDILAVGIKGYREGALFGGIGHNDKWTAYRNSDDDLAWLRSRTGESFEFYEKFTRR